MKNEGTIERSIQATISGALFLGAFFGVVGIWKAVFFVLAFMISVFAIIGFCPWYALLGINTAKNKK